MHSFSSLLTQHSLLFSVVCDIGYYRHTDTNACSPCPRGRYQAFRGQEACDMCADGFTTPAQGSRSPDSCVPGDVNECTEGTAACHPLATCQNTQTSYNCICKEPYQGNGTFCEEGRKCSLEDQSIKNSLSITQSVTIFCQSVTLFQAVFFRMTWSFSPVLGNTAAVQINFHQLGPQKC